MKNLIYVFALSLLFLGACKNENKASNTMAKNGKTMVNQEDVKANQNTMNSMSTDSTAIKMMSTQKNGATSAIIDGYLQLKNALTADDNDQAAKAGKMVLAAFTNFDKSALTKDQLKGFNDIADDAKENAEHISKSPLAHQREHFEYLTKDVSDLIALLGTDKTLYQDFCPMANDNKGAMWLSETKVIKNPYLGSKMPTCGTIKKQIN